MVERITYDRIEVGVDEFFCIIDSWSNFLNLQNNH